MALLMSSALCLLGILIFGPFLEAEAADCDQGWERYKGHCYKLFEDKQTWIEAETQCRYHVCQAHLASIHNKEERLWVANYIRKQQFESPRVWVGLIDFRQNGKWSWTDRTAFKYKRWMKGQPDSYDKIEFCGELSHESGFRELYDTRCNRMNAYLCKRKR